MDIMRKGRVIPAFFAAIVAIAVCLFASGCLGTGPSEASKAQWKPKFVGTWDLQEAKGGDSGLSAEDLQWVREMGHNFYLELKEDGTAALALDDDKMSGTWEVKSENEATFSARGDTMEMKLADDKLTAVLGDQTLTFVRSGSNEGSTTTGTTTPAADNAGGSSTSGSGGKDGTKVDLTPVTIADDEVCKIVVTGKEEDFAGDPGYNLTITNKSDKVIFVTDATGSFSVNGKMTNAYLNVSIKSGMYADSFMYFSRDELGGGLDRLTAVEGEVDVFGDDDFEELGHYPFHM